MKLSPDCIRDILLAVEETVDYYHQFEYVPVEKVHSKIKQYTHDEIVYHIHQCRLSGLFFQCQIHGNGGYITIEDLSPEGHEFLAKIRADTIWNKTKEIAGAIGTKSLDATIQIASAVMVEIVKAHLGLS